MDFLFDVSGLAGDEDDFSTSKKDVLKYLKIIGVDTRFISYTPEKIYINNLRFSRFSRKNLRKVIKASCIGNRAQLQNTDA